MIKIYKNPRFGHLSESIVGRKAFSFHKDFELFIFEPDRRNLCYLFENIEKIEKNIDILWFMKTFLRFVCRSYINFSIPQVAERDEYYEMYLWMDLNNDKSYIKYTNNNLIFFPWERDWIANYYLLLGLEYQKPLIEIGKYCPC